MRDNNPMGVKKTVQSKKPLQEDLAKKSFFIEGASLKKCSKFSGRLGLVDPPTELPGLD